MHLHRSRGAWPLLLLVASLASAPALAQEAGSIAVVVFDESDDVLRGDRGEALTRRLEDVARRAGLTVEGQDTVSQIMTTSQANGISCSFASEASCWVKVGLTGDFQRVLLARTTTAPPFKPLDLRLVDVNTGDQRTASVHVVEDPAAIDDGVMSLLAPPSAGAVASTTREAPPAVRPAPSSQTSFVAGTWLAGVGGAVVGAGVIGVGVVEGAYAAGAIRGPDVLEGAQIASRVFIGAAMLGVIAAAVGGGLLIAGTLE